MAVRAEVGQGRALPGDGADEGDKVPRRQASARPCVEAGAKGVAATLGKVEESRCKGLHSVQAALHNECY